MTRGRWIIIGAACVVVLGGLVAGYFWIPVAAGVSCPTKNGATNLPGCTNTRVPLASVQCVPLAGAVLADKIAHELNPRTPPWFPPLGHTQCAK
jgi:hypothetical protein